MSRRARLGEAIPLFEQTLTDSERVLGPDHPEVAVNLYRLGTPESTMGRVRAAVDHLQRAVSIEQAAYGANHREIPTSRRWPEPSASTATAPAPVEAWKSRSTSDANYHWPKCTHCRSASTKSPKVRERPATRPQAGPPTARSRVPVRVPSSEMWVAAPAMAVRSLGATTMSSRVAIGHYGEAHGRGKESPMPSLRVDLIADHRRSLLRPDGLKPC